VATVCLSSPAGRARWTLELLADEMVKLTTHESQLREDGARRCVAFPTRCRLRRPMEGVLVLCAERLKERSGMNTDWSIKDLRGKAVWLSQEDVETENVVL
jgi:hypothetical protein